jgi:hypothetical protein
MGINYLEIGGVAAKLRRFPHFTGKGAREYPLRDC